jgi:hypothetical protein
MAKNLDYLLDRLYDMNTFLGGDLKKFDYRKGNGNALKIMFNDFEKKYREVKNAQDSRNAERKKEKTNINILRWNNEIKIGFEFLTNVIDKMNEYFSRNKKSMKPEEEKASRGIIINCQKMLERLQDVEEVNNMFKKNIQIKDELEADYRKKLLELDPDNLDLEEDDAPPTGRRRRKEKTQNVKVDANKIKMLNKIPVTEEEKQALEKWKKLDAEIDGRLEDIGNQLDELMEGLDDFDEQLERNKKLLDYVGNEAFKLNEIAQTTNAQMKIILDRFKRPGRMVIDICMGFLLATLLGIFTYLLRRYFAVSGG